MIPIPNLNISQLDNARMTGHFEDFGLCTDQRVGDVDVERESYLLSYDWASTAILRECDAHGGLPEVADAVAEALTATVSSA